MYMFLGLSTTGLIWFYTKIRILGGTHSLDVGGMVEGSFEGRI